MKIHYKILFSLIILLILAAGIGLIIHQTTYPSIPVNESDTSTTVVHIEFPFMDDVVVGDITLRLAPYYGAKQEGAKATPVFGCSPEKYYSAIAYDPAQDQMYEKLFGVFDAMQTNDPPLLLTPVKTAEQIQEAADLAESVWTKHYTSLISSAQVAYMIEKFQSVPAITE